MAGDVDGRAPRPILGAGGDFAQEGQRPASFGEKFHPFTFDQASGYLAPQVRALRDEAAQLPDRLRGERVIVQATLIPNYLAASYHPKFLRRDADLVLVGTRASRGTLHQQKRPDVEDTRTKTLLFAATDASLTRLGALFAGDADDEIAKELRQFQSLSLPGAERVVRRRRGEDLGDDPDEELVWEAVLNPAVDAIGRLSDQEQEQTLEKWRTLVGGLGGEIHESYRREVGGLTFMPVRLARSQLDNLLQFNPLRVIRPMPRLRRFPEQRLRDVDLGGAGLMPPAGGPPADHRIVTFDGGVDTSHPLLAPFVSEGDLTTAPRTADDVGHGTLVTSALLYGSLQAGRQLEPPPAHVDHFRVLPRPDDVTSDDEPYWVLDQIVTTLRKHPTRWQIANLSYGPDATVDEDDDVDRFTAELDQLIHEIGITFTVAVGNAGQPTLSTLGDDRIMAPADGVNVLGVGACDDLHPPEPSRASYSCVGPGRPGLRVQPIGVSFGGSETQWFIGADPGGGFQARAGTSFAAPTAARGLATLLAPLPSFSANLGRAFAAHFAEAPSEHDLPAVGYGRLRDNYAPLLNCEPGTVTVVVQDSIDRGDTKTYALPYPIAALTGMVSARWTLSFTSPTDPQDAVEYTLAGLECIFRPNSAQRTMSPPRDSGGKTEKVDLRTDAVTVAALAKAGFKLGVPRPRSGKWVKSEQTLSEEGKWETLMRYEDHMRAPTLHEPELWITYYERLEGELIPTQVDTSLDFTLVMTIETPRAADLYEQVRADARFKVLVPLVVAVTTPAA
jgi:hypothetical protein